MLWPLGPGRVGTTPAPHTPTNTMKDASPHFAISLTSIGPLIALLLACAFFAMQSDRFLSIQNFSLILQQVMVVGTIAIGQTLIILTAGIDLSLRPGHGARQHRDDQVRGLARHERLPRDRLRPARVHGLRAGQRPARHEGAPAVVHRHARHDEHRFRAHADLLRRADGDRPARGDDLPRQHRCSSAAPRSTSARSHARAVRADVVGRCATPRPAAMSTRSATAPRRRA